MRDISRRVFLGGAGAALIVPPNLAMTQPEGSPKLYFESVVQAVRTLAEFDSSVGQGLQERLATLAAQTDFSAVLECERLLRPYVLAEIAFAENGEIFAKPGDGSPRLVERGWRTFLIRVENRANSKGPIHAGPSARVSSLPSNESQKAGLPHTVVVSELVRESLAAFCDIVSSTTLTGNPTEYKAVEVYSRDRGKQRVYFSFGIPGGDHSIVSRFPYASFDAESAPSADALLRIRDHDGTGCMASLTIRDAHGRLYPPSAVRIAPDLPFHRQVYRADGETIRLPDGTYIVETWRGPEYIKQSETIHLQPGKRLIDVHLQRWIDPAKWKWYSAEAHMHASGCSYYVMPTEGVKPETTIRSLRGEGLFLGEVFVFGPSYFYQRQFFTGRAECPASSLEHPELQEAMSATFNPMPTPQDAQTIVRYDLEASGFPSSAHGHPALLGLKTLDYPGTNVLEDWPSWNLPIMKWARQSGALAGYVHVGSGYMTDGKLPSYNTARFRGFHEAVVDVTHDALDFVSGCEVRPEPELNVWYHILNCGYRVWFLGGSDYPCVGKERPGVGRTYVQMDQRPVGDAGYQSWIASVRRGKIYVGDGRSHILEFCADARRQGEGVLALANPQDVEISGLVAARLEPEQTEETRSVRSIPGMGGGWHLERARIGETRTVAVEVVVNGQSVAQTAIDADGSAQPVHFSVAIEQSSWIALRILGSSHTNPIFASVGDRPIRASRRSAEWCRECVDKLWEAKAPFILPKERDAAEKAYRHARATYDSIIRECKTA